MKSCPHCGKPLEDHDTECPYCLAKLEPEPAQPVSPDVKPLSYTLGRLSFILMLVTTALGILALASLLVDVPKLVSDALAFGTIGSMIFLVLGLVLALVSKILAAVRKNDERGPRMATWTINLGCLFFILAILTALAAPRFIMIKHRKQMLLKMAEVKQGLAQIADAELAYYKANGHYAATFDELKWRPPAGHVFAYYLPRQTIAPPTGDFPAKPPDTVVLDASSTGFTAAAMANLNDDPDYDLWSIDQTNEAKHIQDDTRWKSP